MAENLSVKKKQRSMKVALMYPLGLGRRATFVDAAGRCFKTSTVVRIAAFVHYQNGGGYALFETENTFYALTFTNYAQH